MGRLLLIGLLLLAAPLALFGLMVLADDEGGAWMATYMNTGEACLTAIDGGRATVVVSHDSGVEISAYAEARCKASYFLGALVVTATHRAGLDPDDPLVPPAISTCEAKLPDQAKVVLRFGRVERAVVALPTCVAAYEGRESSRD